jgi:hypothetical protein
MLLVCAFADGLVAKRSDGMTDHELLELAAKAAGYRIAEWVHDGNGVDVASIICGEGWGRERPWQPLLENQMTDADGDALRLAVKLRMQIDILDRSVYALAMNGAKVCELDRAAVRRAVVRAAAEIGRAML